jgi:iron complex outermembrane receptor protein
MDKVIVTASRQEEKITSVPANVTVISTQEIENSPAETVAELLRTTPGVLVNDITGNGRNITVDLRGFGETAALNTLLLIDGRRINQADLSGVDWTLIPKDRIQKIEIVYGGRGSVLYGDNAAGGVINIITKKGDQTRFSGGVTGGSYETLLTRLATSGSMKSFSYALNTAFQTSDGYRDNSGTNAKDIGLNLDYFASDSFNVALTSGYHKDDTDIPGVLLLSELDSGVSRTTSTTPDNYADTKDYYVQVVPQFFFTDTSYFNLETSARKKENDSFYAYTGGTFDASTTIDTIAASPKFAINEKIFGLSSKIVTGFDYIKNDEDIQNDSVFFGSPSSASYDLSKENMAVYGTAEVSLTDKLSVSGGYRYDHAKYKSSSAGVSDSVTMDENLYNTGLTYQFSDKKSAYVSYARSFRYPVLDEMFNFFTNTFDSTLGPQTTDDFEIGTRIQFGPGINLNVNFFRLKTYDEIFYDSAMFANVNYGGNTKRKGVEITVSKSFTDFSLSGSYTYMDAEFDGGRYDGNDIPNVPSNKFTLGAEANIIENIRLNVDGAYIGSRPYISDFANAVADQKSYFYLAAKLAYMFKKGSAYVTVQNALDKEYSQYGGVNYLGEPGVYPSPKINFLLGVTFDI